MSFLEENYYYYYFTKLNKINFKLTTRTNYKIYFLLKIYDQNEMSRKVYGPKWYFSLELNTSSVKKQCQ